MLRPVVHGMLHSTEELTEGIPRRMLGCPIDRVRDDDYWKTRGCPIAQRHFCRCRRVLVECDGQLGQVIRASVGDLRV